MISRLDNSNLLLFKILIDGNFHILEQLVKHS